MPTELNKPGHTERYCHPCQHLLFVNAVYGPDFASGDYKCMHPEAHDLGPTPSDPEKARLAGEIDALIQQQGRPIGPENRQPDWCPLRRKRTAE